MIILIKLFLNTTLFWTGFTLSTNYGQSFAKNVRAHESRPLIHKFLTKRSRMGVIVLPNSRPRISGGQHTYHVGDWVRVNCTSDKSKPAADLQWYINGREVCTKNNQILIYQRSCPYVGFTVSYRGIKQKVITQANDYRRVKAYTP